MKSHNWITFAHAPKFNIAYELTHAPDISIWFQAFREKFPKLFTLWRKQWQSTCSLFQAPEVAHPGCYAVDSDAPPWFTILFLSLAWSPELNMQAPIYVTYNVAQEAEFFVCFVVVLNLGNLSFMSESMRWLLKVLHLSKVPLYYYRLYNLYWKFVLNCRK